MARKKSPTLTEAELRVMEALWRLGRGTVSEVSEAMPPPPLAYNTVLTTLRILETKGHVAHEEAGRAYIYEPLIEREAAAQSALKQVVSKFFDDSTGALALRLIENERPSDDELARLRSLIEKYEDS
ncbi:MAG TPA: BlaI/MecI/CopY family transcriptional regulator [Candidatus Baltobacteraceae bacterium]|nr:BlaI/MecI/CopY family transcriptional regulator [Candidatus Baltobacteraceae bacterium]